MYIKATLGLIRNRDIKIIINNDFIRELYFFKSY